MWSIDEFYSEAHGELLEYYEPEVELEILDVLEHHLQDGEVAVFMETGYCKMRYLTGIAFAINSEGEAREVNLNDIYDLAEELTDGEVTRATY